MAKMPKICKKIVDLAKGTVTFKIVGQEPMVAEYDSLSDAIKRQLGLHGLSQKLGDAGAGAKEAVEMGLAPSAPVFFASQVRRVWDGLKADVWTTRETGPSMLARAIAEAFGRDAEEVQERLNELEEEDSDESKAKLKKMRNAKAVQQIMARLKKEALERKEAILQAQADDASDDGIEELLD